MPNSEILKTGSAALPWITTAVGWATALFQWRKKRRAEAALQLIRRRGDAPYFVPSSSTVDRLLTGASPGQAHTAAPATVLSVFQQQVPKEIPAGTPVRLIIDNQGLPARHILVTLDGEPIQLPQYSKLHYRNRAICSLSRPALAFHDAARP